MHKKITTNTKHITDGDVFFCFLSAEKYLNEAILKKVSKIYCEKGFLERIKNSNIIVNYSQYKDKIVECIELKNELVKQLKEQYKIPQTLIAITGTKGKTSTSWFTMQLLGYSGEKCGYIGTLGVYCFDGKNIEKINNNDILTTPSIDDLYYYLNELYNKGANVVVFEASSHSLQQGRIEGLDINCSIFTNLSQDHLDYHKTMDEYFLAKSLLFSKYQKEGSLCVLNAEDDKFLELYNICNHKQLNVLSVGRKKNSDVYIEYIGKENNNKQNVKFVYQKKEYNFYTDILGDFQILNITEAMFACYQVFKINIDSLCKIIHQLKAPLGRMQKVKNTNIFVDFAHTPKSLEESIKLLKQNYKKVVVVFGCGGNRDKQKRPIMCEIALRISDFVIITSDNPRFEDPANIIDDIICFVLKDNKNELLKDTFVVEEIAKIKDQYTNDYCNYKIIENRRTAIKYVIDNYASFENVAILIAGKGHENYQIIKDTKYHFDDVEEVNKNLKSLNL